MKVMTRLIWLVICGALLAPGVALAQAPAPDLVRELLTEVRALRIAMERAATTGARIQLLVARVQLQEQRIAELSRRAAAVREELSKIEQGIANYLEQVKRMRMRWSAESRTRSSAQRRSTPWSTSSPK